MTKYLDTNVTVVVNIPIVNATNVQTVLPFSIGECSYEESVILILPFPVFHKCARFYLLNTLPEMY